MANKTDGLDPDQAVVDFYSLGLGEIYPIAASHGRGVLSLLEHVLLPWMEDLAPQEEVDEDAEYWAQFEAEENGEEEEEDDFDPQSLPIKLAIVGRPNVGKSTLTNRILVKSALLFMTCLARRVTASTSQWNAMDVSMCSLTPLAYVNAAKSPML